MIIFALAVGLVSLTRFAYFSVSAETRQNRGENLYVDVLNGDYEPVDDAEREAMGLDDVDRLVEIFHARMNRFFNEKIRMIVKEKSPRKMVDLVKPPAETSAESGPPRRTPCTGKNASTYCLAQIAVSEYDNFRAAMSQARERAKSKAVQDMGKIESRGGTLQRTLPGAVRDLATGSKSLNQHAKILRQIDRELDVARQTMDKALAAYNELQFALPLHIKYGEILQKLILYRNKISNVRRNVELYPDTFLNVTTSSCT